MEMVQLFIHRMGFSDSIPCMILKWWLGLRERSSLQALGCFNSDFFETNVDAHDVKRNREELHQGNLVKSGNIKRARSIERYYNCNERKKL
jgi:hypothetical protein